MAGSFVSVWQAIQHFVGTALMSMLTNRFLQTAMVCLLIVCSTHGHYTSACPLLSWPGNPSGGMSSFSGNTRFRTGGSPRFGPSSRFSQRSAGSHSTRPAHSGSQTDYRMPQVPRVSTHMLVLQHQRLLHELALLTSPRA